MRDLVLEKQAGGLKILEWPCEGMPDLTVMLMHGYGADAWDLLPLSQEVNVGDLEVRWLFPNAPLGIEGGGRAWWPIDFAAIQMRLMAGQGLDYAEVVPPGIREAADQIGQCIAELGVDRSRLVLGGFSQGAMTSLDHILHSREGIAGAMLLSGSLGSETQWKKLASLREGQRFFQSHGRQDPILGFGLAERLNGLLVDAGWKGPWIPFEGGHAIPPSVIDGMGKFLREYGHVDSTTSQSSH